MQISPGQNQILPEPAVTSPAAGSKDSRTPAASPAAAPVETIATPSDRASAPPLERPTRVTLHQDANGRAYYLVSDAQSGQEIVEIPPKAVRDVGQGIQEYLKQEETKATSQVEIKA